MKHSASPSPTLHRMDAPCQTQQTDGQRDVTVCPFVS